MLPVIVVEGDTLPEVWERSVVEVWSKGIIVETEYNELSKDCVMIMIVRRPLAEPRIHRGGLVIGRLKDLEDYVKEVVEGVRDHLVKLGKIPYTYHERLFSYEVNSTVINQIDYIVDKLSRAPFSRRAQAITWKPWIDTTIDDPPCLQRIHCRVYGSELVMQAMWRSRDAFKAAFMNMYALTELQSSIARELSERLGFEVRVGEYIDISNSYHIYESDWNRVKGFIKSLRERRFEDRVWTTEQYTKYFNLLKNLSLERESQRVN